VIRFSPPRHGVRREKRGVIRHPATKVVAAPLVTATVVAMDFVDSPPQPQLANTNSTQPTAPQAHVAEQAPPTTTVPVAPTTIAVPPTTTSTTSTATRIWTFATRIFLNEIRIAPVVKVRRILPKIVPRGRPRVNAEKEVPRLPSALPQMVTSRSLVRRRKWGKRFQGMIHQGDRPPCSLGRSELKPARNLVARSESPS